MPEFTGGRSPISTTHELYGATRVMAACIATGQAAGIAAQMAAHHNIPGGKVNISELQTRLKKRNAILSKED